MTQPVSFRALLLSMLALLAIALATGNGLATGQEPKTAAKSAAAPKAKKSRGRLPSYYRAVVDEKQREAIYEIQEEYASKIAALKAQLAAVMKERDEKITAVLTPEQLKKVEDAAAAAKAKRGQKKAPSKKPAAKTPAN